MSNLIDKVYLLGEVKKYNGFPDIIARLSSIWIGITCIQKDIDKIYTYLKTLAIHSVNSST